MEENKTPKKKLKTYRFSPHFGGMIPNIIFAVILMPVVIGIFMFMNLVMKKNSTKYTLSPKRLTVEKGIMSRTVSNLELWRITDIQLKQSGGQVVFGGCSIELITKDISHPVLRIEGMSIKRGRAIYKVMTQYIAHALNESGVMNTV